MLLKLFGPASVTLAYQCQWKQLPVLYKHNWINFDFIKATVEVGTYKGNYVEFEFALMGFVGYVEFFDHTVREAWAKNLMADIDLEDPDESTDK